MSQSNNELFLSYSQDEGFRELRRLRRNWLRIPHDHMVVELGRVFLVLTPFLLFLFDLISESLLMAYLIGYFANRLFEQYMKPWMVLRFGPRQFHDRVDRQIDLVLDDNGVRVSSEVFNMHLNWSAVSASRIGGNFILRLDHDRSIPVMEKWLPKEWDAERLDHQIREWTQRT